MAICARLLVVFFALLIGGVAWAQEPKGWFGADVQEITKAEADKLGWDAPRGAMLGIVAPGSPAHSANLKTGDIIDLIDGFEVETSTAFEKAIEHKRPGAEIRLRVRSGGREQRVTVTLGERPKAQAADAGLKPLLMLDTGGHMARIDSLAFTHDGKQLVSAGNDRVIRVWDWKGGRTVRTIRGQVRHNHEGRIYAMALSPDGRWLAAGGFMAPSDARGDAIGAIRLYDFPTGKLVALLKGHTYIVTGLAFSPDSKRLVSGSDDMTAAIWDVESSQLVHRLEVRASVSSVAFTLDGARVATADYGSKVKLWSAEDGKEIATLAGHKDTVNAIAVSPEGTIASGSWGGEIRLWDNTTGQYLRTLGSQGGLVGAIKFSLDGKRLLSVCGHSGCNATQRVWDVATGGEVVTYRNHDNIVIAAAVSLDGRLAATGGGSNNEIHIWDLDTGETKHVLAGTGAPGWATGFSADGSRIGWGTKWKDSPGRQSYHLSEIINPLLVQLRLSVGSQVLGRPDPMAEEVARGFARARTIHGDYALGHRKGGALGHDDAILDIKKDGQTLASIERQSTDGYIHRAYSFTPDGQTVISGGDGGILTAYDLNGQRVGDFVGHEFDILAVTPSPDGRLLASGSADQTIRLWNLKTRELIVTLFHGSDGEWVMWTPHGYYTGSPGADRIVGWQINKGWEHAAEYVGAEQLRSHLNRPDIVEKAIILASAEEAVREAPGTTFQLADLLARPVPRFKIISPRAGSTREGGRATVTIAIEATPDPIRSIRVQVNGRQVEVLTPPIDSGGFGAGEQYLEAPLAKGRNEVRVTLANAIGEKAETLSLSHDGEGELDRRGTLHILAIGVNEYKGLGKSCGLRGNEACDLRVSSADARVFADTLEKRLGPDHSRVSKRVLVNGGDRKDEPTARNVADAVELLRQTDETDTVVLFIAGHGKNEGPSYRFLPTDAEWVGGSLRGSTVVPWQILQEAIEAARGRRLLFVDTCHSGNAYNQRLGNTAYHANIIAYSAARFDQAAMEDHKLGHGIFTYAVVEGLEGKAGIGTKRQISTKELADYLVKRVAELARELNGEQEPQYFKGRDAEDSVLARW